MSRFARPALVAGLTLVAVVVAGCGKSGATTAPAASVPAGTIAVEAKEYSFTPSTLTVPAGDVTFQVRNAGSEEHRFEIFKGDQLVDEIKGLLPGLSKPLTVTLPAGTYEFKCLLNGHDQIGMKGTLTVTGS